MSVVFYARRSQYMVTRPVLITSRGLKKVRLENFALRVLHMSEPNVNPGWALILTLNHSATHPSFSRVRVVVSLPYLAR